MCLLVYEADPNALAGLLLGRSKLHPVPVQLSPADGEADSKARAGSRVGGAGDSGAGACPLRCGGWSWGFWWLDPCPGAAVH